MSLLGGPHLLAWERHNVSGRPHALHQATSDRNPPVFTAAFQGDCYPAWQQLAPELQIQHRVLKIIGIDIENTKQIIKPVVDSVMLQYSTANMKK